LMAVYGKAPSKGQFQSAAESISSKLIYLRLSIPDCVALGLEGFND
jgi:hypothetical protein